MSNEPLLSIIIAVYNTANNGVLNECLDSIFRQELLVCDEQAGYEVICVDDGSTDASPSVLEQYETRHSNMIVVSQKNHGAAYAKNIGIKKSHGKYLWIINSDDCIQNGSLKCILATLSKSTPDLLKIRLKNIDERFFSASLYEEEIEFTATPTTSFIEPPHDDVTSIIRSDIVKQNNLMFRIDMKYHYDRLFGVQYYSLIDQSKTYLIDAVVYLRRQRATSEMGKMSTSQEARKQYYFDSTLMAIEYHKMLSTVKFNDSRMREFIKDQEAFFIENAIVILPSTGLEKKKELNRLEDAGVYPYSFNYKNVKKAKSIKNKTLVLLRSILPNKALYSIYYYIQSRRKKL